MRFGRNLGQRGYPQRQHRSPRTRNSPPLAAGGGDAGRPGQCLFLYDLLHMPALFPFRLKVGPERLYASPRFPICVNLRGCASWVAASGAD